VTTSTQLTESAVPTGGPLGSVADDMGIFLIAGRTRNPALALREGEEAERLGFRRAWLSERYDLKDSGAVLSGVAARTRRLEVGTGVLASGSRHPLIAAAFAATMHAMYDGRFILGLGRSDGPYLKGQSIPIHNMAKFKDYVDIVRRLLEGDTVRYSGPLGEFEALKLVDLPENGRPEIWSIHRGGPRACQLSAEVADGVMLQPFMTVESAATSVRLIRSAREQLGLDPGIRICLPVITACELDDLETTAITKARLITYVQMPVYAKTYVEQNRWDQSVMDAVHNHPQFSSLERANADQVFHRHQLLEPASLIPDSWMRDTCAIGSVDECIAHFDALKEIGVDEFALYGSTPAQNAKLITTWRARRQSSVSIPSGGDATPR
jgi:5,10-methylenetetrahydromethanopterin reductase